MKDSKQNNWEQDKNERLNIEEYQREEEVVATVFQQKQR